MSQRTILIAFLAIVLAFMVINETEALKRKRQSERLEKSKFQSYYYYYQLFYCFTMRKRNILFADTIFFMSYYTIPISVVIIIIVVVVVCVLRVHICDSKNNKSKTSSFNGRRCPHEIIIN
jgi:Flp pilus assembly protein TadB